MFILYNFLFLNYDLCYVFLFKSYFGYDEMICMLFIQLVFAKLSSQIQYIFN